VRRALLLAAALSLHSRESAAAVSEPCATRSGPRGPDDPRLREWLRALVHDVAQQEGVDPHALEALGMTETSLRPALGRSCELGPFQVMPWWAAVFRLESPEMLWDPRINAIAAARIYKDGWRRWDERFAHAGKNRVLRAAGWRGPLDRATFAALAYQLGQGAARVRESIRSARRGDPRFRGSVRPALQPGIARGSRERARG
jgi:hypothetical protein